MWLIEPTVSVLCGCWRALCIVLKRRGHLTLSGRGSGEKSYLVLVGGTKKNRPFWSKR